MNVKDISTAIERLAPLSFQEEYDNAGLQAGFMGSEVRGILVCLDITEDIIEEAHRKGLNLIVSHHPLIFRKLARVSDETYQQRCVCKALSYGIALYSAHTNLDNAKDGVNHKIAELLGLHNLDWLIPNGESGSGMIGDLPKAVPVDEFLDKVKTTFRVRTIRHSAITSATVQRIAVCGGAGAFLSSDARLKGADCFITGELHYHDYFESEGMLLVELGHYESEQFTCDLLHDYLAEAFPSLRIEITNINTNPIEQR